MIKDIHHYGDRLKAWAFKLKCREQMEELRPVRDPLTLFRPHSGRVRARHAIIRS